MSGTIVKEHVVVSNAEGFVRSFINLHNNDVFLVELPYQSIIEDEPQPGAKQLRLKPLFSKSAIASAFRILVAGISMDQRPWLLS